MPLTLLNSIAGLFAQRKVGEANAELDSVFERLSTGLRINRAGDDAAGLAISESINADVRVFTQGVRNLNDGLSLLSIADSATEQLTTIVTRIQELAEQAASEVIGYSQRQALDAEAQALSKEFARIIATTEFNGLNPFSNQFGELGLQAGYGTENRIASTLGGAVGTGGFGSATQYSIGSEPFGIGTGDFNNDGFVDIVMADADLSLLHVRLGDGTGAFSGGGSYAAGSGPIQVITGDFNNDGILDLASADSAADLSLLLGDGQGGFGTASTIAVATAPANLTAADFNGDGNLDIATTTNSGVDIVLGDGKGGFGAATTIAMGSLPDGVIAGDFTGDGILDLATANIGGNSVSILEGDGAGGFSVFTSFATGGQPQEVKAADLNNDGILDIVSSNRLSSTVNVLLMDGSGGVLSNTSYSSTLNPRSLELGDFNGDGSIDVLVGSFAGSAAGVLLGNGDGSFGAPVSYSVGYQVYDIETADFNNDGVLDFATANFFNGISVALGQTSTGLGPIVPFSLATFADARQAMPILENKLKQIGEVRGAIGALQSRIGAGLGHLEGTIDTLSEARGRIVNADIAEEAAKLVRLQVLQRASTAVLAQANQQSSIVLQLLKN